jgi:hypothetical protein
LGLGAGEDLGLGMLAGAAASGEEEIAPPPPRCGVCVRVACVPLSGRSTPAGLAGLDACLPPPPLLSGAPLLMLGDASKSAAANVSKKKKRQAFCVSLCTFVPV